MRLGGQSSSPACVDGLCSAGAFLAGLRAWKPGARRFCREPEVRGGSLTTLVGPHRLFALEARSPAKPGAWTSRDHETDTSLSRAHLRRHQIYRSSQGAHLHLWCIAHRCAAYRPLLSRFRAGGLAAIYCALSQRARAPSERRGKRPTVASLTQRDAAEAPTRQHTLSTLRTGRRARVRKLTIQTQAE